MIGYLASGQVSTVFAFAWLPWLLIATEDLSKSFSKKNVLHTAAILSTIIFADIRWGFFCGLFASAYLIVNSKYKKEKSLKQFRDLLSFIIVVILMSAILTLPLLEFMSLSGEPNYPFRISISSLSNQNHSLDYWHLKLGLIMSKSST